MRLHILQIIFLLFSGCDSAKMASRENTSHVSSTTRLMANATDIYPIYMADPLDICADITFRDGNGDLQAGLKECGIRDMVNCSSDGEINCKTSIAYRAASVAGITNADVASGKTIAGVSGVSNLGGTPANCGSDGIIGCLTTATYKAIDTTIAVEGIIRSGVTIAGVLGGYPSAVYPLVDATPTDDLAATTFNTQIKSATAFEYWDSAGVRQTGVGDTNIVSANIASTVSVFGTSGEFSIPKAWDLKMGTTVETPSGTLTGKLKSTCRNTARLSFLDIKSLPAVWVTGPAANTKIWTISGGDTTLTIGDEVHLIADTPPGEFSDGNIYYVVTVTVAGGVTTFELASSYPGSPKTASTAGSGITQLLKIGGGIVDYWDSIDDFNASNVGLPHDLVSGWGADNQCGDIEATADDSFVWKDVTTTGDGITVSHCSANPANCSYLDKISGNEWSKHSSVSMSWPKAVVYCDELSFNGKSDWRLPTQKEAMAAYEHGIRSTETPDFISSMNTPFWSSTTSSVNPLNSIFVNLASGETNLGAKNTSKLTVCVRP